MALAAVVTLPKQALSAVLLFNPTGVTYLTLFEYEFVGRKACPGDRIDLLSASLVLA